MRPVTETLQLPPQQISIDVLIEKYAKGNETTQEEIFRRVARGVASAEKTPELQTLWEEKFFTNMLNGAVGAGRIMSAGGSEIAATMINCFTVPVGDSISGFDDNGRPGIYTALQKSATTMQKGGGVGYNFSFIRPKGAWVKSVHSTASGPCSYMDIFDASCKTIESAGCFTGDTLINTTDGLIPIKQIVESDKDFYAITHMGPKKVTAKFKNGVKPILEIVSNYGFSVKVTKDHKFAQFDNGQIVTRRIEDIIASDNKKLLISVPVAETLKPDHTDQEAFAYVVGAFHGNGTWIRDEKGEVKGVSISNNITKQTTIEAIYCRMAGLGISGTIKKVPNENTIKLSYYDKKLFSQFEEVGITKGDMTIPEFILKGDKNVRASYLAGLFDADGHFNDSKSNIRLRMISRKLLKQVQVVLASLGVMSKFSVDREPNGNWQRMYCVGIFGSYAQEAFFRTVTPFAAQWLSQPSSRDRVGFSHPWEDVQPFGHKKATFSNYWSGDTNRHPTVSMNAIMNTITTPELVNTVTDSGWFVVELPEEETYDLEVEDVHLLSGDGFYTSNSRRGAQMGILNIDHPDILEFVKAKRTPGRWNNFNVSVMVTDDFMRAKKANKEIELVHLAPPSQRQIDAGAYMRPDGFYVYGTINAVELWDVIMKSNYDYAEPGVLFFNNINNDNNLRYVETIVATNPCAEQPLPDYGCCDLGPIILPRFVRHPFTDKAFFDFTAFRKAIQIQVRFLDNVLDATVWPLEEEKAESDAKRRIGLGFTGLGNALAMLNKVYYEADGVETAREISEIMRNTAYEESVELAKEKGAFPLFDADKYLEEGTFASRLPEELKNEIRRHGIRNSHLLSIAPTGTVSLAFADNASNGIEPPFSLAYTRKKREGDGSHSYYNVLDHSFRVWLTTLEDQDFAKAIEDAVSNYKDGFSYRDGEYNTQALLPKALVTAMTMTVDQHLSMMRAVQPFIDTSISKTVNVPGDYPYEDFKKIYDDAWNDKLKGVSTYRPNDILGSVLSVEKPKEEEKKEPQLKDFQAVEFIKSEEELEAYVAERIKLYAADNGLTDGSEKTFDQFVDEMYSEGFQSRKDGMLTGITTKGRFFTEQGEQKFIVTINFIEIKRNTVHGPISITRPVEFILTSNFTTNSSAWDATMRFMSLSARSGVTIPKLIENLKEITWEHGAVRYGTKEKDGRQVPLWHASDVAAIGHAIQEALVACGYLDTEGKVVRPKPHNGHSSTVLTAPAVEVLVTETSESAPVGEAGVKKVAGSKCQDCGANAVIKSDGCLRCTECGWLGSCG